MKNFTWFRKNVLLKFWGRKNLPGARFRIRQEVKIVHTPEHLRDRKDRIVRIRGMNKVDGDDFEYITTQYPFMLYQDDLKEI
jgi:hypothetical protein